MGDNGFAELAQVGESMRVAGEAMRNAKAAVEARDARIATLEEVLAQIVDEYENTYDGDQDSSGYWTAAASIPLSVMERARVLIRSFSGRNPVPETGL